MAGGQSWTIQIEPRRVSPDCSPLPLKRHEAAISGGGIGHRADYLIFDDLLKSQSDSMSETVRERIWANFSSAAETRLLPDGKIIGIQTRWHSDDVHGRLLRRAQEDRQARQFVTDPSPISPTFVNFSTRSIGTGAFHRKVAGHDAFLALRWLFHARRHHHRAAGGSISVAEGRQGWRADRIRQDSLRPTTTGPAATLPLGEAHEEPVHGICQWQSSCGHSRGGGPNSFLSPLGACLWMKRRFSRRRAKPMMRRYRSARRSWS
jgi:hypothetical protein